MSQFKRKTGHVCSVRIRPADCMRIVELAKATGIKGTFPQMVAGVLAGLLEAAQRSGAVHEPDLFQYKNTMDNLLRATNQYSGVAAVVQVPLPSENSELDAELYEVFENLEAVRVAFPAAFSAEDRERWASAFHVLWPGRPLPE